LTRASAAAAAAAGGAAQRAYNTERECSANKRPRGVQL